MADSRGDGLMCQTVLDDPLALFGSEGFAEMLPPEFHVIAVITPPDTVILLTGE
jgi:hypothetical protein